MDWWAGPSVASINDAESVRKTDPAVAADLGPRPKSKPLSIDFRTAQQYLSQASSFSEI